MTNRLGSRDRPAWTLRFCGGMLVAILAAATAPAAEEGSPDPDASLVQSVIGGGAAAPGPGNQGVVAINIAAGDINAQANTANLSLNLQGGSTARITTQQSIYSDTGTPFQGAIARIENGAFADTAGLISVNQASGKGNVQANGIVFALGVEGAVIADSVLAQTAPQAGTPTEVETSPNSFREASIAEGAFRNLSGVAQINQSAGSGNATANNFVLRMDTKL